MDIASQIIKEDIRCEHTLNRSTQAEFCILRWLEMITIYKLVETKIIVSTKRELEIKMNAKALSTVRLLSVYADLVI